MPQDPNIATGNILSGGPEGLAGPILMVDSTAIGLTDDDIKVTPNHQTLDISGAQTLHEVILSRTIKQGYKITGTIQEAPLSRLKWLLDSSTAVSSSTLTMTPKTTREEHTLEILSCGADNTSRRFTATGYFKITGDINLQQEMQTKIPFEFTVKGNVTTNAAFVWQETAASATLPAKSSFQKVVAGVETTITTGATNVEITAEIQITMNKIIAASWLTQNPSFIRLTDETANGAEVSGTLSFGATNGADDYTKLVFTPDDDLTNSNDYRLSLTTGIEAVDGTVGTADTFCNFTTAAA